MTKPSGMRGFALALFGLVFWFGLAQYRSEFLEPRHFPEQRDWLLTGDEPAYLMMALALHRGEGVNVRGVAESGAYEVFQTRTLPVRHDQDWTWSYYQEQGMETLLDRSDAWGDAQILWMPPFYSAWLSPLFHLDIPVRRAHALVQAGLLTLLACLLLRPALHTGPWTAATVAMALAAGFGGIPVGYYTTQVFPELMTLSCLLGALMLFSLDRRGADAAADLLCVGALLLTPRSLVAIALMSGFRMAVGLRRRRLETVLIHPLGWGIYVAANLVIWGRLLPPAAGGLLSLIREQSHLARVGWIAAGGVAVLALAAGSLVWAARSARPRRNLALAVGGWVGAGLAAGLVLAPGLLHLMAKGVFMQFLSRDMGLFFSNPLSFVSLIACAGLVLHRWDRTTLYGLLLFLGYLAVNASFPDYRAGRCPMGRYQVLLNGLLVAGLVRALATAPDRWRDGLAGPVWLLGAASLVIAGLLAAHPNFWYRDYHPLFAYKLIQRDYGWLPQWGEPHVWALSFGWLGLYALTFAAWFGIRAWRNRVRGRTVPA